MVARRAHNPEVGGSNPSPAIFNPSTMFQIDFFELLFLAEACIPPRPIARMSFWEKLLTTHYNELSPIQRKQMFESITNNPQFNKQDPDCQWFYARYNPDNQYQLTTDYNGKKEQVQAFRKDDKYWTTPTRYVAFEYVVHLSRLK